MALTRHMAQPIVITDVKNTYEGFQVLAELAACLKSVSTNHQTLDMTSVTWFAANMVAPLRGILAAFEARGIKIDLAKPQGEVCDVLCRNGFLVDFGSRPIEDKRGTVLKLRRFRSDEHVLFAEYIDRNLLKHRDAVALSGTLRKKINRNINEIFDNSATHAEARVGIFCCGQLFPQLERLDLSIADTGVGIPERVRRGTSEKLDDVDAIDWALQEGNTTRRGQVPGGIGLKVLREYMSASGGRIQIASGKGYWEMANNREVLRTLENSLPGTVVTIEFNTTKEGESRVGTRDRGVFSVADVFADDDVPF